MSYIPAAKMPHAHVAPVDAPAPARQEEDGIGLAPAIAWTAGAVLAGIATTAVFRALRSSTARKTPTRRGGRPASKKAA